MNLLGVMKTVLLGAPKCLHPVEKSLVRGSDKEQGLGLETEWEF